MTTIAVMACTIGVMHHRIERIKHLTFPDGGYRWVPYVGMKATLDLSKKEFEELYPEEWKFLKNAKLGPFTPGVSEKPFSVYDPGQGKPIREEQDDPEGAWKEIEVGDGIEISDPATTWTGRVDKVEKDAIWVHWQQSRDIFNSDEEHPFPDPLISKSMGIELIRTGWIDLLDY